MSNALGLAAITFAILGVTVVAIVLIILAVLFELLVFFASGRT